MGPPMYGLGPVGHRDDDAVPRLLQVLVVVALLSPSVRIRRISSSLSAAIYLHRAFRFSKDNLKKFILSLPRSKLSPFRKCSQEGEVC